MPDNPFGPEVQELPYKITLDTAELESALFGMDARTRTAIQSSLPYGTAQPAAFAAPQAAPMDTFYESESRLDRFRMQSAGFDSTLRAMAGAQGISIPRLYLSDEEMPEYGAAVADPRLGGRRLLFSEQRAVKKQDIDQMLGKGAMWLGETALSIATYGVSDAAMSFFSPFRIANEGLHATNVSLLTQAGLPVTRDNLESLHAALFGRGLAGTGGGLEGVRGAALASSILSRSRGGLGATSPEELAARQAMMAQNLDRFAVTMGLTREEEISDSAMNAMQMGIRPSMLPSVSKMAQQAAIEFDLSDDDAMQFLASGQGIFAARGLPGKAGVAGMQAGGAIVRAALSKGMDPEELMFDLGGPEAASQGIANMIAEMISSPFSKSAMAHAFAKGKFDPKAFQAGMLNRERTTPQEYANFHKNRQELLATLEGPDMLHVIDSWKSVADSMGRTHEAQVSYWTRFAGSRELAESVLDTSGARAEMDRASARAARDLVERENSFMFRASESMGRFLGDLYGGWQEILKDTDPYQTIGDLPGASWTLRPGRDLGPPNTRTRLVLAEDPEVENAPVILDPTGPWFRIGYDAKRLARDLNRRVPGVDHRGVLAAVRAGDSTQIFKAIISSQTDAAGQAAIRETLAAEVFPQMVKKALSDSGLKGWLPSEVSTTEGLRKLGAALLPMTEGGLQAEEYVEAFTSVYGEESKAGASRLIQNRKVATTLAELAIQTAGNLRSGQITPSVAGSRKITDQNASQAYREAAEIFRGLAEYHKPELQAQRASDWPNKATGNY